MILSLWVSHPFFDWFFVTYSQYRKHLVSSFLSIISYHGPGEVSQVGETGSTEISCFKTITLSRRNCLNISPLTHIRSPQSYHINHFKTQRAHPVSLFQIFLLFPPMIRADSPMVRTKLTANPCSWPVSPLHSPVQTFSQTWASGDIVGMPVHNKQVMDLCNAS